MGEADGSKRSPPPVKQGKADPHIFKMVGWLSKRGETSETPVFYVDIVGVTGSIPVAPTINVTFLALTLPRPCRIDGPTDGHKRVAIESCYL